MAHHINARDFLCSECPRAYNTAADLAQHHRIHEKQRDPYNCGECGMLFQIRSKYNTHMRTHQAAAVMGPKECTICNKKFVCLSSHNRIVHLGMRAYPCTDCGKSFGKKSGLDRHILTVHEKIKAFKCEADGCHGAFGEKSQLTKHMRIHTERDQSYCSFCKQQFENIKNHFDLFHQDLTYACDFCFKRFSKQSSLNIHVKVFHTMEKNFFCDYCPNKGFAERSQLKRHLRRHQDESERSDDDIYDHSDKSLQHELETVFVNDLPKVKLETESIEDATAIDDVLVEIKEEIMSDEEVTDIKCEPDVIKAELEPYDDVGESQEYQITSGLLEPQVISAQTIAHITVQPMIAKQKHDKTEEPQAFEEHRKTESSLACDNCDKTFSKQDHLKTHYLAAHTENKFDCQECRRSFSYKSALDRHVKVVHKNQRNHFCSKCGKSFGTRYDLALHFEANHDESKRSTNRRTCKTCGKIFSKERNLQIHILAIHSEKSFECEVCSKKFSFKSAKERHLKVVHYNQRSVWSPLCRIINFLSFLRSHQCIHCQKFFGTKYDLRNHISYNHSMNPAEQGKYYCKL